MYVQMSAGKQRKAAKIEWGEIRRAIVGGEPYRSVAERYKIGLSRLSMRAVREGWTKRELKKKETVERIAIEEGEALAIELEVEAVGLRLRRSSIRSKVAPPPRKRWSGSWQS